MMKLKVFNILLILICNNLMSQESLVGIILDNNSELPLVNVAVFNSNTNQISYSDINGNFKIDISPNETEVVFYLEGYNLLSNLYNSNLSVLNESENIRLFRVFPDFCWHLKHFRSTWMLKILKIV